MIYYLTTRFLRVFFCISFSLPFGCYLESNLTKRDKNMDIIGILNRSELFNDTYQGCALELAVEDVYPDLEDKVGNLSPRKLITLLHKAGLSDGEIIKLVLENSLLVSQVSATAPDDSSIVRGAIESLNEDSLTLSDKNGAHINIAYTNISHIGFRTYSPHI